MIYFDGVDLCTIAPVKIVDIAASAPKINIASRTRPLTGGVDFARAVPDARQITITFALLETDMVSREKYLQSIRSWAKPGKVCKLVIPTRPDMYINAVCKALPDPSARQWWEDKLKIVFMCCEPFFRENAWHTVESGATAYISGDATPLAYLTAEVTAGNNTITISDGTRTMVISGIMSAGTVKVDLESEVITHSVDGNIDRLLTLTSRYPVVKNGQNTITGAALHFLPRWY